MVLDLREDGLVAAHPPSVLGTALRRRISYFSTGLGSEVRSSLTYAVQYWTRVNEQLHRSTTSVAAA
eukprot:275558-Rhodomonas_salina.2